MSDDELEINFKEIGKKVKGWFKSSDDKKPKEDSEEEEDLDLSEVVNFLKNNKQLIYYSALIAIILVGSWIRTLSINNYNDLLLGLDPYVFYRYANTIVETGGLPKVDTLRYFPEGLQTFREHQVLSYFIAYSYKIFSPVFGGNLVDYAIIYPVIAFAVSMIFFYLMVKEIFNKKTALIGTAFLALAPSYLFRTIAGFGDKESLATVWWFSMLYFLVKSLKAKKIKKVLIYGLTSGVISGLAGLTWGGAKFLMLSIGGTFISITLLNRLNNNKVISYFSWLIPTILMNSLLTLRYGGFISIIREDMFIIPSLAGALIILRLIIPRKNNFKKDTYNFIKILIISTLVITPIIQFSGLMDITHKVNNMIETIIHPFGTCPFCVSVTENQTPWFIDPQRGIDWWQRLKWHIPLFMVGAVLLMYEVVKKLRTKKSIPLTISFVIFMTFFMFSRFINDNKYQLINNFFSNTYLLTLPLIALTFAYYFIKNPTNKGWDFDVSKLLIITWFALSVIGTRGAIRIIFASTPIFVLISAYSLTKINEIVLNKTKDKVYASIPYLIAILIIIWSFQASAAGASGYYPSFTKDWNTSMNWVKTNTSEDAVFTHWWDYGYWVQTMGERATTLDGGNYKVKWDEIVGGKLFSAYNMTEAYESLDYFKNNETGQRPNYFLVMDDDVLKYVQMANIGGRPGFYAAFTWQKQQVKNEIYKPEVYNRLLIMSSISGPGMIGEDVVINGQLFPKENSYIINILIPINDEGQTGKILAVLYNAYDGSQAIVNYECVCEYNKGCTVTNETNSIPDCVELLNGGFIHIPSNLKNRLMTHLYLLNESIPGFNIAYTTETPLTLQGIASQSDPTDITIYELNYTEMKKWVDNGSPAWGIN